MHGHVRREVVSGELFREVVGSTCSDVDVVEFRKAFAEALVESGDRRPPGTFFCH